MKTKLLLLTLIFIIISGIIFVYYPRNIGNLIEKKYLLENVTKIEISQTQWIENQRTANTMVLEDREKIKELIEYLSKEKVRLYIYLWETGFNYNGEDYRITFYGNQCTFICIYGNIYLTKGTKTYKFTSNFQLEYIRKLFKRLQ